METSLRIGFHSNQICLQGTEIALYDYADYCESLFGHQAVIFAKKNKVSARGGAKKNHPLAIEKFSKRFKLYLYETEPELQDLIQKEKIDVFYAIKRGNDDGIISKSCKSVIHAVFKVNEPHGDVYAYVSKWLSQHMTQGQLPYVPHMIDLPDISGNLRDELGIPQDATVLGRYGGMDSFDIPFVHEAIEEIVNVNPNIYFLFMNTDNFFVESRLKFKPLKKLYRKFPKINRPHKQILFLPGTQDMARKVKFIQTCDAMMHARYRGETFGIAIGEFSLKNKPIFTFSGKGNSEHEENHLLCLKDGFFYDDKKQLIDQVLHFNQTKNEQLKKNWNFYAEDFSPHAVMNKFKSVFLD